MSEHEGRVRLAGIRKTFGQFEALKGVDLDIEPREFFALLGPSGSGKSTTLRVIAGLEPPDAGTLTVDGADVTYASPGERDIAMVFQSYALYPHMTLAQNIGFPLKMDGVPKPQIAKMVEEAARKVKIEHLLKRRPGQLSGGQQQRCALARAIVRQPRLFLLDEPLSNLDAQLRTETRVELKRLHQSLDTTTIYVTHDQEEAMTIADRMAIFFNGEIVQIGVPGEIFDRPDTMDVAAFIGNPPMNLMKGRIEGARLTVSGYTLDLPQAPAQARDVVVGVRPGHLRPTDAAGLGARLILAENLGESMILNLEVGEEVVKARLPEVRRFTEGAALQFAVDPAHVHLFDPETRRRIV